MSSFHRQPVRLYDRSGERLYCNLAERQAFLEALSQEDAETRKLGLILFYTGCRLSEALALRGRDLQAEVGVLAIRTLKQRQEVRFRELCIPQHLIDLLLQSEELEPFVPVSRTTAWRRITGVMAKAGIRGKQACPKGLRHSFGVKAVLEAVPLPTVARWMGHASLQTTAIYTTVVGDEERELAKRMWG